MRETRVTGSPTDGMTDSKAGLRLTIRQEAAVAGGHVSEACLATATALSCFTAYRNPTRPITLALPTVAAAIVVSGIALVVNPPPLLTHSRRAFPGRRPGRVPVHQLLAGPLDGPASQKGGLMARRSGSRQVAARSVSSLLITWDSHIYFLLQRRAVAVWLEMQNVYRCSRQPTDQEGPDPAFEPAVATGGEGERARPPTRLVSCTSLPAPLPGGHRQCPGTRFTTCAQCYVYRSTRYSVEFSFINVAIQAYITARLHTTSRQHKSMHVSSPRPSPAPRRLHPPTKADGREPRRRCTAYSLQTRT